MFNKKIIPGLLSALFLSACGGGSGTAPNPTSSSTPTPTPDPAPAVTPYSTVQIEGAVQKGPFVIGSTVTVNQLSADAINTDSTVITNTIDDLGRFNFLLNDSSDLIELSGTGYYRNEITGELSQGTITLRSVIGLSDREEQTAYINLLTHLTSQRIRNLISESELHFEDAKNQAEREFLTTFSEVIPNDSENDFASLSIYDDELSSGSPYLLSMSSILYRYALNQSNANSTNPDAELTQLLNALEADFGEDGVIDDTLLLESLRATIPEIDPSLVSSNLDDWIDGVDGFVKVDINEYLDTDLDGIFNSIDTDDDNDGVKDELDPSPYQQSFIVADQAVEGNEDQSIEVDIETNNPLGIEVRVEVTTSPSNGVVSGNYPTLRYSPNANFEGSDTFSYRLRQGEISSEIVTVKVSVIGENDAPLISGAPGTEILAYNAYSFVPTISDIENDSLEFSVQNLPSWASFNSLTGEVAGTPSNENVGVFPEIIISVTDGESSAQLKAFDLEVVSNPWQVLPNLPTYRRGPEGVEINGKIYVLGGLDQNNKHMSDVDVFDTSNKSWESMTSMQTARWSHTANTVDNQIYAIGGQSTISIGGNSTINSVEVFNLVTQRWTAGASMGTPRDNHSSCVYDGEIYVFGGRNGPTTLTTVEKYNPVDDSWSYRESNSNLGWGSQCVTFGDEIYVFGGASNEKGFEVYDPVSDLWVRSGVLDQPMRYGFSVEAIDQNIYIIGGYIARDTVHVFDTVSSTWSENTAMPIGKQSMGSVMLNGAIYLFGGINGSVDNVPSFEKYDPAFEKK